MKGSTIIGRHGDIPRPLKGANSLCSCNGLSVPRGGIKEFLKDAPRD